MSHSPTRSTQLPRFLLMILAATSCGESRPKQDDGADGSPSQAQAVDFPVVPKDLVSVALTSAQNNCSQNGPGDPQMQYSECKDHKIQPAPRSESDLQARGSAVSLALEVTDADRANGIEDKWCVTVSYLARRAAEPWQDVAFFGEYTKRIGGAWQYQRRTPCMDMLYVIRRR